MSENAHLDVRHRVGGVCVAIVDLTPNPTLVEATRSRSGGSRTRPFAAAALHPAHSRCWLIA